jgi:transposase
MKDLTQFVGIDLHQDSITLAVLPEGANGFTEVKTLVNEPARLRRFLESVSRRGPVKACDEAGSCGYVLHRRLRSWGYDCEVIAPSRIPRASGDRVKTDRRDAEKLARLHRLGELTPVHVPTEVEERTRSLVRCRGTLTREILASRHYILKLLLSRGHRFQEGKNWSQAFWSWLRKIELPGDDALTLGLYIELLEGKLALRQRVDTRLEVIAAEPAWKDVVGRLRCLRGVDTLSALTLACEVADPRRFATARHLMAYLGLNVSEFSSGSAVRRGAITKAGNTHCRHVLVEAAWHDRHPPRLGRELAKRMDGQPEAVRLHSMRAQRRLHRRFDELERRMPSKKAVVAVARELVGFVWALLRGEDRLLAERAPRS